MRMRKRMRMRLWLALSGLLLAPALLLAQAADTMLLEKYKALAPSVEKAKGYLLKGDEAGAERELRACLDKLPEHHQAHFMLSQLFYKRGAFESALEHILAAESGCVRFQEMMRRLQVEQQKRSMDKRDQMRGEVDQLSEANDAAKERASCQTGFYQLRYQKGVHALEKAEKDAEDNREPSSLLVPAEYHYHQGNCLFRLRRYPEAENAYRDAIQNDSRCGPAYVNLINLYYIQNKLTDAKSVLSLAESNRVAVPEELKKALERRP